MFSWPCHANVREPAMVPYQGGSASNIGVLFSQLRVKIVVPQVSEMSLLRCDVVLAGCKQVSGPRGQDEILLLKLHLIVVCMRISLRTSSSSYVRPDTWRMKSYNTAKIDVCTYVNLRQTSTNTTAASI